jgi:hypothetical protein
VQSRKFRFDSGMAEAQEGLWMSAKERDRLKVLHEVRKRHITQKQAALVKKVVFVAEVLPHSLDRNSAF